MDSDSASDLRLSRHLRPQPPTAPPRCAPRAALSRECVCGVLQIAHRGTNSEVAVKSTKFAIAGAKRKNRNFIEICHTRVEIMASKFPMAAIRNSDTPQVVVMGSRGPRATIVVETASLCTPMLGDLKQLTFDCV